MERGKIIDIRLLVKQRESQASTALREGKLIRLQERLIASCIQAQQDSGEFQRRLERVRRFGGDALVAEVIKQMQ